MKRKNSNIINKIEDNLFKKYKDKTLCNQYALWMLEKITGKKSTDILFIEDINFTQEQLETLDNWIFELVNKDKPLQYILGYVPFCELEIIVEPPILIPRPETEEICYYAIGLIKNSLATNYDNQKNYLEDNDTGLRILDIGTGSGCIALSLAKNFPKSTVYACDISDKALELAQKNAKLNNINNVIFIKSDVYSSFEKNSENFNNLTQKENIKFDLIISNPPYISEAEYLELDESVKYWEDKGALTASNNGLEIIEKIIFDAPKFLKKDLKESAPKLIIEIGYKQGLAVKELFINNGFLQIKIKKDLEGKDRFVVGYL